MSTPLTDEQIDAIKRSCLETRTRYFDSRPVETYVYLDERKFARAILSTQSTNTAGPEPRRRLFAFGEKLAWETDPEFNEYVTAKPQDVADAFNAMLATPTAPATAGPEPVAWRWSEAHSIAHADRVWRDGPPPASAHPDRIEVAYAPIAQPPASPTDVHSTESNSEAVQRAAVARERGTIVKALAAIVNCPTPDKLFDLDAIPRDPVMTQVTRIKEATYRLSNLAETQRSSHSSEPDETTTGAQPPAPEARLPEISDEDKAWISDNPNTDDLVEWIQNYARAALSSQETGKPAPEALKDALRRLWPLIEKATNGYVFTAEKAGEVAADKEIVRAALSETGKPTADLTVRMAGKAFDGTP